MWLSGSPSMSGDSRAKSRRSKIRISSPRKSLIV